MSFSDKYLLLSKWLWRQGFVRTPSVCSEDTPHSDCMPSCPQQLTDHAGYGPLSNHTAYELLKLAGVFNLNPSGATWTETIKESGLDFLSLLKELCHVGSPGDMFTSAAPQDPTFWPLHGNGRRRSHCSSCKWILTLNSSEHHISLASYFEFNFEEWYLGRSIPTLVQARRKACKSGIMDNGTGCLQDLATSFRQPPLACTFRWRSDWTR